MENYEDRTALQQEYNDLLAKMDKGEEVDMERVKMLSALFNSDSHGELDSQTIKEENEGK